jgi:Ca2+-binding RTX toxin-like protein
MDKPIVAALWRGRRTTLTIGLAAVLLALFASVAYAATIEGTPRDDRLVGTDNTDTIYGRGGDDLIRSLGARDVDFGNTGNDDIYGGEIGDQLFGNAGDDYLVGDGGADEFYGAGGDDVIVSGDDKRPDTVRCGTGYDIAYITGRDHSALLSRHQCEEIHQFESFDEIPNPGGTAGP